MEVAAWLTASAAVYLQLRSNWLSWLVRVLDLAAGGVSLDVSMCWNLLMAHAAFWLVGVISIGFGCSLRVVYAAFCNNFW